MPIAVFALSLSMFAIGTTEFVIVGLLPTISSHLGVSVPTVGLLVTAYALGIAIGGPLLTSLTGGLPRKRLLLTLMALFVVGNVASGLAPSFEFLLVARILTAFTHAVFASAGVALAVSLVSEKRQGRVIAAMFGGVTIALVLGVPLGTFLGQHLGWRTAFYGVAIIGAVALIVDARLLPEAPASSWVPMRRQLSLLADPRLMLALLTTVIGFGGQIVAYTYIAPFLEHVSGFGAGSISPLLVVFGSAAAAGTFAGGHAIDRWPRATPVLALGLLAGVLGLATLTAESTIGAIATLVAWGSVGFALSPVLQHQAARAAPHSPDIVSALNISAFNFGIAGGALIGGRVVAGDGIHAVTWVGGLIVAAAALLAAVGALTARPQAAAAARSLSP